MQIVDRIGSAKTTHTLPEKGHRGPWQHPDAASVQGFPKLFRARFGGGARWLHRDDVGSCRRAWARRGPASLRPSIPAAHWPEGAQLSHPTHSRGPGMPAISGPCRVRQGHHGCFWEGACARAMPGPPFLALWLASHEHLPGPCRFFAISGSDRFADVMGPTRCRITGNSTGHQPSWAVADRIHDAKLLGICGPLFLGSLGRVLCFSIPSVYIVGLCGPRPKIVVTALFCLSHDTGL